jgi:hypothetical protein
VPVTEKGRKFSAGGVRRLLEGRRGRVWIGKRGLRVVVRQLDSLTSVPQDPEMAMQQVDSGSSDA